MRSHLVDPTVPSPNGPLPEPLVVSLSSPVPGVLVARVVGEIDLLTDVNWVRALRTACVAADGDRPWRLVCDLSAVTFFGATGLSGLIRIADTAGAAGVELRVVDGRGPARRSMELTALDRRIPLDACLPDATAAPRPGRRGRR